MGRSDEIGAGQSLMKLLLHVEPHWRKLATIAIWQTELNFHTSELNLFVILRIDWLPCFVGKKSWGFSRCEWNSQYLVRVLKIQLSFPWAMNYAVCSMLCIWSLAKVLKIGLVSVRLCVLCRIVPLMLFTAMQVTLDQASTLVRHHDMPFSQFRVAIDTMREKWVL